MICPYCHIEHDNKEFAAYCGLDCAMAARREYNKMLKYFEREQKERRKL